MWKNFLLNSDAIFSGRERTSLSCVEELFCGLECVNADFWGSKEFKYHGSRADIMPICSADVPCLMVTGYMGNGFLSLINVGNLKASQLSGSLASAYGKKTVQGVLGIISNSLKKDRENLTGEDLCLDTGLSEEQLRSLVSIGDYVGIESAVTKISTNIAMGRACGIKACICAMAYAASELKGKSCASTASFAVAARGENKNLGLQGVADTIMPKVAILVDAVPASSVKNESDLKLGKGAALVFGCGESSRLQKFAAETARNRGIAFQSLVENEERGEISLLQTSGDGIPVMRISIPVRYPKEAQELVDLRDIEFAGRLIACVIEEMEQRGLEKILCY